jgi:hypothetical protein
MVNPLSFPHFHGLLVLFPTLFHFLLVRTMPPIVMVFFVRGYQIRIFTKLIMVSTRGNVHNQAIGTSLFFPSKDDKFCELIGKINSMFNDSELVWFLSHSMSSVRASAA